MSEVKPKGISASLVVIAVIIALIIGVVAGYFVKPVELIKETVTVPGIEKTVTTTIEKTVAGTIEKTVTLTPTAIAIPFTPPPKPEKIVVQANEWNQMWMKYLAESFEKEYGIKVEFWSYVHVEDLHTKTLAAYAAKSSEFDVIGMDEQWRGEYFKLGVLEPLNKYFEMEGIDPYKVYEPFLVDASTYKGQQLYVLTRIVLPFLFYNEKMLKEAGYTSPPTTWEELVDMSKVMMNKGICKYGTALPFAKAEGLVCQFTMFLHAFGGRWFNEKGEWAFNDDAGIKALTFMRDMIYTYKIAPTASVELNDRQVFDPLGAGDSAFSVNWNVFSKTATDPTVSKEAENIKVALAPGTKAAGVKSMSVTGFFGWGIYSLSKNKYWAWKFLLHQIMHPEISIKHYDIYGVPDSLKITHTDPFYKDPIEKKYYWAPYAVEQVRYAASRPGTITYYGEWTTMMQEELHKVLLDPTVDIKSALDRMVELSREMARRAGS